jgi:hypothetical protein
MEARLFPEILLKKIKSKRQDNMTKSKIWQGIGSIFLLAAIATLLPCRDTSKGCLLGYGALCSFAPYSTIICFLIAVKAYGNKNKPSDSQ